MHALAFYRLPTVTATIAIKWLYVKAWLRVFQLRDIKHEARGQDAIKHETKPSALSRAVTNLRSDHNGPVNWINGPENWQQSTSVAIYA